AWTILRADRSEGDPSWSSAVCRDISSMPEKAGETWFALLDTNDHAFHLSKALPKPAVKALAALDPKEFEARMGQWTQALSAADRLHVTTACLTMLNFLLRLCHALPAVD